MEKYQNRKYKFKVGETVKNILITSQTRYLKSRAYNGICQICGDTSVYIERSLLYNNIPCHVCNKKVVKKGFNDLATTDPWMVEYFVNKDESTMYLSGSNEKVLMKCPICGKSFRPSQWKVITCSKDCASKYKSLINKKEKPIWDGIEKKNMWNYSQIVDNNRYLYAMCPQHPKSLSTGYVYLHRLIVENYLGRILKDDEVVHHKDFNRKNNSIENLLVLSQSEHSKLHWNLRKGI